MRLNANGMSKEVFLLKLLMAFAMTFILFAGCSSAPSVSYDTFILKFIQKHIPMIDKSVATFYVKEERAGVIDRIEKNVDSIKKEGSFKSLSTAKYDFSNIKVEVVDQKQEYVNDEAVDFMKVEIKGKYTKTINGKSETLSEDEIIILESVAGKWKVTEKINPWES
jgi:hypothetical protein